MTSDEAFANLDKAIQAAADASGIEGMVVDWVVCLATRDISGEDNERDDHAVGYLTDGTTGTPDYRVIGLLEYVRDMFRSDVASGEGRTIE